MARRIPPPQDNQIEIKVLESNPRVERGIPRVLMHTEEGTTE